VSHLEALLRVSLIQVELRKLAEHLGPKGARIVNYATNILNLLRQVPPR
jgi:hypothetical protein